MSEQEKCPKCGEHVMTQTDDHTTFGCESVAHSDGGFSQSLVCVKFAQLSTLTTERDAAVKECERLREELSDMRDDAQFVRGTLLEMAEVLTRTHGADDES